MKKVFFVSAFFATLFFTGNISASGIQVEIGDPYLPSSNSFNMVNLETDSFILEQVVIDHSSTEKMKPTAFVFLGTSNCGTSHKMNEYGVIIGKSFVIKPGQTEKISLSFDKSIIETLGDIRLRFTNARTGQTFEVSCLDCD